MAHKYSDMAQVEYLIDKIDSAIFSSIDDPYVIDILEESFDALLYLVDEVRELREVSVE